MLVQRHIQKEHVDPWLAQEAPVGAVRGLGNYWFEFIRSNRSRLGDSCELPFGIGRADVGI